MQFTTRWFAPAVVAAHLTLAATASAAQERPLPESTTSTIGYATVDAALAELRAKPGVVFSAVNGWTIATDEAAWTIWSFAPREYPAYPAVVMRQVVARGEQSAMQMKVLCEATKAECDDLVRTFARMNGVPLPE